MKRALYCLMISLLVIIGFLGCSKKTDTNINITYANNQQGREVIKNTSVNAQQVDELNRGIRSLIAKSIEVQYGTSDIDLTEIFSDKFIKKIQDTPNFYKKELKPYKITSINHDEIKGMSVESFVVYVRVEDAKGQYQQNVYLTKKNGMFVINEIQYDI